MRVWDWGDSHRLSAFKHETAALCFMKPSTKHADNAMNWSNCGPFIVDAFQCRVYDSVDALVNESID